MRELDTLTEGEVASLRYVLTDVDDTITTRGKLRPEGLAALWKLHDSGLKVICVTGGSAGWGDTYLRQWPVEAVLSESGAVCLYREDGVIRQYVHPSIKKEGYKQRVQELIAKVLSLVPEAKISSDQFARIYDIAFDHGSEPPFLHKDKIAKVVDICQSLGAGTAVSSIHVNAWFGEFDKRRGTEAFFRDVLGLQGAILQEICCYCGDAPNDQVMFSHFPLSFGVGNIRKHTQGMHDLPRYIAKSDGGAGFFEIAEALLRCKVNNSAIL
ncbi:MAG: HAD-IIB family hydrolase [Sphaerochaeta sp.]|nr:HAD-IIB family hydrolase [Sphaerochaeta sp.]